jgi:putative transposase
MLTYKYPIYPTPVQEKLLQQSLDNTRYVYNWALNESNEHYKKTGKKLSKYDLCALLPKLKSKPTILKSGREIFLKETYAQCYQATLARLDEAYQGFFRRAKNRNGKKAGFPKFKTNKSWHSIVYPQVCSKTQVNISRVKNNGKTTHIHIPILGDVKLSYHRPIGITPKICILKRDKLNRWWVCLVADKPKEILPKTNRRIAIDLGVKNLLVDNKGRFIENPKFYEESENKLKKYERKHSEAYLLWKKSKFKSTKYKDLMNKWSRVINHIWDDIKNKQRDFLHKLSIYLINKYDEIAIEDLNIKGMLKKKKTDGKKGLRRRVAQSNIGLFVQMLTYKAVEAGRQVIKVNPKNTSQNCYKCQAIVKKSLGERNHNCKCGVNIDRDYNAALNIYQLGFELEWTRALVPDIRRLKFNI